MKHNIPGIYEFLTRRSFRNAVYGQGVPLENCVLGDENRTMIHDAEVFWKSDCIALKYDGASMGLRQNNMINYIYSGYQ